MFNALGESYELIVIDTKEAMDDSKEVCDRFNVKYVNRKGSNSYGDAVRTGVASSCGTFVIFMDADGSHEPEFIKRLIPYKESYHIVIASRYTAGGGNLNASILILMSKAVNMVYSAILGLQCKDISNSFRLYHGEQLRSITLQCNHFDILEEILLKLVHQKKDFLIKEVPFVFKKRVHGRSKRSIVRLAVTYLISLVRLRLLLYIDCEKNRRDI